MIASTQEPMTTAKAHEWKMIAEKALAELAELKELYLDRDSDLKFEYTRAERAEAALERCEEKLRSHHDD